VGHPSVEQFVDGAPAFLPVVAPINLGDQFGGGSLGVPLGALDVPPDGAVAAGLGVTTEGDPHLPAVGAPAADAASHKGDDTPFRPANYSQVPRSDCFVRKSRKWPLTSGGSGI
jgi:hypothetical protein